jgi:excisionase family DNA binding protein
MAYSLPEVAALIGVSFGHIRNEVRRGTLKSFRSGHRLLVGRAALNAYVGAL